MTGACEGCIATQVVLGDIRGIVAVNGVVYASDFSNYVVRVIQELTCFGISPTNPSICGGQGTCVAVDTCNCTSGWQGNAQCSAISCDALNNCNGNGACTGNNTCTCNSGWQGNSECCAKIVRAKEKDKKKK